MEKFPEKLRQKLEERSENNALRALGKTSGLIDFSSNDYLGFSKSKELFKKTAELLSREKINQNGSTGSRLLSGNSDLYEETENLIANFHKVESALIFNSGYDANLGFFASVPQRGDLVFYDEYIHASIRDGIRLGTAKALKFKHNDLDDLERGLRLSALSGVEGSKPGQETYIITESVFSMDGDSPDLKAFANFCSKNKCRLVVDEAHAVGVFGENLPAGKVGGTGLVQELELENTVFARIVTFGKALGIHGAAILGSGDLKNYLVNFCRSFVYTTALPPHSVASIQTVYKELQNQPDSLKILRENISFFKNELRKNGLEELFIPSNSAIQACQIPGNEKVKNISEKLKDKGFDVKPILSPTVPEGKERLRFCLHAYNSMEEISEILITLSGFHTLKGLTKDKF